MAGMTRSLTEVQLLCSIPSPQWDHEMVPSGGIESFGIPKPTEQRSSAAIVSLSVTAVMIGLMVERAHVSGSMAPKTSTCGTG